MRKVSTLILFLITNLVFSQFDERYSVVQEHASYYHSLRLTTQAQWDSLHVAQGDFLAKRTPPPLKLKSTCDLKKRIFGWHPYWMGSAYTNYDWNLISDFCYFDYTIEPTTGKNVNTSFAFATSAAVTAAKSNGVNVWLCATLFASHATFLATDSAKNNFTKNMISLLKQRGGKGINIDFENVSITTKAAFVTFIKNFSDSLKANVAGSELSICLPAVDWSNYFDATTVTQLKNYVDFYTIMGYDYYWSGSSKAGPTDPLYNFEPTSNYTLSRTITYYLNRGISNASLFLGVPYYGREWETVSDSLFATPTKNFTSARLFSFVKNNAAGNYSAMQFDSLSYTPYYTYINTANNKWRRLFINNAFTMEKRFEMVNNRNLGGIGIWALGYDDGYQDYWNTIRDNFTTCANDACSDTLFDMGGPFRNYYDRENYTYTIQSDDSTQKLTLTLSEINIEANFDTLWVYDGGSLNSPLIKLYSGVYAADTLKSTKNKMTIRFKSDGATTRAGWKGIVSCMDSPISVSVRDLQSVDSRVSIYPNPVSLNGSLQFKTDATIEFIRVLNVLGEVVYEGNLSVNSISANTIFSSQGVYFVQIKTGNNNWQCKKIIVD